MRKFFIALVFLLVATPVAAQNCTTIGSYKDRKDDNGKVVEATVKQTRDGIVVFTANMDINSDGALQSYKIDDLGFWVPTQNDEGYWQTNSALNNICNGVNIKTWSGDPVYSFGQCKELIAEFKRIRDRGWIKEGENYVEFYAIALSKVIGSKTNKKIKYRGIPCEKDGYYVSQVAKPIDPNKAVCDPERWVDALRIPAIVLPLDERMRRTGVKLQDLVLVRLPGTDKFIGAIVGDTNPVKIGEATIITAMKLRGLTAIPKNSREVVRLVIPGWRGTLPYPEYIVFPGTAHLVHNLSNSSFDEIQKQVAGLATKFRLNERPKLCN